MDVLTLKSLQTQWACQISERLQKSAPSCLWTIGNREILAVHKIGLFCSVSCPDDANLAVQDSVRKLREDGATVISGFHSPMEKECLRILLEGKQSVIICLAHSLGKIRLPAEWRKALESNRLLLLSRFEKPRRADKETVRRRNELVAALSDEVLIIHAEPGGSVERISELIARWHIPLRRQTPDGA